jgi:tRNA dimethylallyltransferase
MKKVVVIVGPTASGKTGLSIEVAKHFQMEIINGDSVQVYQDLNIGAAKIKATEMQNIKHHMLDIATPKETYSVFHFQRDARRLINQIERPLIVGGTGLYIKACLYNYEFVESARDLDFESKYENMSNEEIYDELIKLDSEIQIDIQNRRRVIRALEQAKMGFPRSQKSKKDQLLFAPLIIYLDLPKNILEERLIKRLNLQIEEGFIEEVEALKLQNIAVNAIGYRELRSYLDGEISLEEAKAQILLASKRLAKKQKTFFKNQMNIMSFDALSKTLLTDVIKVIDDFYKRG